MSGTACEGAVGRAKDAQWVRTSTDSLVGFHRKISQELDPSSSSPVLRAVGEKSPGPFFPKASATSLVLALTLPNQACWDT